MEESPLAHIGFRATTTCIGVNQPLFPPITKLSAPSRSIALVATLLAGASPRASNTTSKLWLITRPMAVLAKDSRMNPLSPSKVAYQGMVFSLPKRVDLIDQVV